MSSRRAGSAGRRATPPRRLLPVAVVVLLLLLDSSGPGLRGSSHADLATATNDSPTGRYANGALLMDGRLATPAGRVTALGDLPLGIAVSPDGRYAVVTNGGQGEGGSVGAPDQTLQVVDLATGGVVQTVEDHLPKTDAFYNVGVAFAPRGDHLYAAGGGNDAVYDYAFASGRLSLAHTWVSTRNTGAIVPFPSNTALGGGIPTSAPEVGDVWGYSRGLAVTPDGATVVVANEQGSTIAALSTASGSITWETQLGGHGPAGLYPGDVSLSSDGGTGVVTLLGANQLLRFSVATGLPSGTAPVGDHPNAVRLSQDNRLAYVTAADDDSLSVVDLSGTVPSLARQLSMHLFSGEANGSAPDAVAVDDARGLVYVANAGDNAVTVVGIPGSLAGSAGGAPGTPGGQGSVPAPTVAPVPTPAPIPVPMLPNTAPAPAPDPAKLAVLGFIPTGLYPSAVATAPDGASILAVSAKGYGGVPVIQADQFDGNDMVGLLQTIALPSQAELDAHTARVRANVRFALDANARRSADNPIPDAAHAGQSPIKHVVLIVRENRTFDQEFGDLALPGPQHRDGVDAVPDFLAFPRTDTQGRTITVNAHDIAARYGLSDNFYSNGDASIQGHDWTAEGITTDYVERSWVDYYSNRNHTYDPTLPIGYPRCGSIFQSLAAHGIPFRNFGELQGLATTQAPTAQVAPDAQCATPGGTYDAVVAASSDVATGNNLTLTSEKDTDKFTSFRTQYDALTTLGRTPAFSYLVMGNDHTNGTTAGQPTPQALVATNDQAIGEVVDYLSRRPDWSSTAVFVEEDDSQDGMDHRDGHRNILLVASPWVRPGAVSHLHISQASVMRMIELILGVPPLSSYTQQAPVPYDLFGSSPANAAAYTGQVPTYDQSTKNTAAAAGTASAYRLPSGAIDRGGPLLEAQVWEATRPGEPMPSGLLAELRARGGVSPADLARWG